jgi:hypothetical protein
MAPFPPAAAAGTFLTASVAAPFFALFGNIATSFPTAALPFPSRLFRVPRYVLGTAHLMASFKNRNPIDLRQALAGYARAEKLGVTLPDLFYNRWLDRDSNNDISPSPPCTHKNTHTHRRKHPSYLYGLLCYL